MCRIKQYITWKLQLGISQNLDKAMIAKRFEKSILLHKMAIIPIFFPCGQMYLKEALAWYKINQRISVNKYVNL